MYTECYIGRSGPQREFASHLNREGITVHKWSILWIDLWWNKTLGRHHFLEENRTEQNGGRRPYIDYLFTGDSRRNFRSNIGMRLCVCGVSHQEYHKRMH
jgi:hypothetical protein